MSRDILSKHRLGELFTIARGGSPRPINDFITESDSGFNWVKISDATNSGKFIHETKEKILPEGLTRTRRVYPGDFILSNSMSFGRPYIMAIEGCIHDGWLLMRPNDNTKVDRGYFYYLLGSNFLQQKFSSQAAGSAVRNLNIDIVSNVEVHIPPLPEQRRIAEILSSVDDAIATAQAVIEQTKKVKQATIEHLLTKGIGHTRFKQTEIGEIPELWEVVRLDDITPLDRKITYGIVQAGPDYLGGIPYIRVSDMGEHQINEVSVLRTSPEIASNYLRSELQPDDIVFALRGKVGHVLRTPQSLAGANLTQGTARIACGGRILSEFLLWALRSPQSVKQYKKEVKGSTFQELTLGSLKKIQVPLPSLEEQMLLATSIEKIEAGLRGSEQVLLSLAKTKSSLMSDLLTGRKRVTDTLPLAAE